MSALPEILEISANHELLFSGNIAETPDNQYGWKSTLTTSIRFNGTMFTFKMEASEEGITARVELLKKQIRRVGNGESDGAKANRIDSKPISTRRPTAKAIAKMQLEAAESGDLFYLEV